MSKKTTAKKIKTVNKAPRAKASDMLFFAVIAFFCNHISDVIKYIIKDTALIDVVPLGDFWWTIIYRALSCVAWAASIYILIKFSKKVGFDPVEKPFEHDRNIWISGVLTATFIAAFVIMDGGFGAYVSAITTGGLTYLIFMAFNVAIRCLIIAFAQKSGEICFNKVTEYVPWGGIFLGILRFLSHLIVEGSFTVALLIFAIHLYFGVVYVFTNRKLGYTIPMVFLMLLTM